MLMPDRRDALCAASEPFSDRKRGENERRGGHCVITGDGICDVFPGAVNSIPSRVHLTLDIRDTDLARRDAAMRAIETAQKAITAKRNVTIRKEIVNADAPVQWRSLRLSKRFRRLARNIMLLR